MSVQSNGSHAEGPHSPTTGEGGSPSLAALRETPENIHLFRGYGPLVVGLILFVLMVTLAPTVAPERDVERPVNPPTSTTTIATSPPGGEP